MDRAGIILSPADHSNAHDVLAAVGTRAPLLLFNRELGCALSEFAHWDQLMLDNQRGTRLATEHLIERGHRRIAFFGGHDDSSSCRQRQAGYAEARAIVGCALVPLVQGFLANHIGIQHAFVLPLLRYVFIVYYGLRGSKIFPPRTAVDVR